MNTTQTTATWTAGLLTVTIDGATETAKARKAPAFLVIGTGNQYTQSGIWFTKHATRAAAFKAQGEGTIVPVVAA